MGRVCIHPPFLRNLSRHAKRKWYKVASEDISYLRMTSATKELLDAGLIVPVESMRGVIHRGSPYTLC